MVARINTGKCISKALSYNEQKVKTGAAELLSSSGFLKGMSELNFYDKMRHFDRLTSLNERVITNSLHVSLNFDKSDILDNEKLKEIAITYMSMIGFGEQPYLVYRHTDSGHPHIHIVSTNIDYQGNRISMHNIGRNQSEKARKEIETRFSLIKAERKTVTEQNKIQQVNAHKVIYGKHSTKQAISNVLKEVIGQYKFSSLPEFNAILSLYNVSAYRGEENSKMYQGKGLVYRVMDERGMPMGSPIKASAFYNKPTLTFLEGKFLENEPLKQPLAKRFKVEVEFALAKVGQTSMASFVAELEKGQISPVIRQNKEGLIYGITYVDHKTKTVFNGSDLGKEYSAKGTLERLGLKENMPQPSLRKTQTKTKQHTSLESHSGQPQNSLADLLLLPEPNVNAVPYPYKKDAKKKKRKRLSL